MYGTQTSLCRTAPVILFENDVKMYGTQTKISLANKSQSFENDVKMYGTQTKLLHQKWRGGLRMM